MTPDLAELRRLADEGVEARDAAIASGTGDLKGPEWSRFFDADSALASAARSAVPVLCAEVDRLRGLLDRCETALAHAEPYCSVARAVLAELRAEPNEATKG